jgi:hypothetical protein
MSQDKVKELEDDYKETLDVERKEMEDANTGFKRQIDFIKKSAGGTVSAGAASSPLPSVSAEGGAESASAVSGGGGGGGGAGGGGGSLSAGGSAPSGSEMSQSSSQVAEGQRMESAADAGSVVNSPTTNNSTAAPDGAKPPVADAYNEEFARLLAKT